MGFKMTQQYSLRWNNHQPNFISMFTSLLNTQSLVDVTLAAEGKHVLAHKVVLSACSTYFQSLFVDNPSRHPIVILKDVTFAHLRTMVDFMYYGEVNVAEDQLEKVLDTAKTLKIKGLTEMPDSTSVMRSQGAEYQPPPEPEQRPPSSPAMSPSSKRRRRRKSSSGSANLNLVGDESRPEGNHSVEQMRETITLSSLPQHRRSNAMDDTQQPAHASNISLDTMSMDAGTNASLQVFAPLVVAAAAQGGAPLGGVVAAPISFEAMSRCVEQCSASVSITAQRGAIPVQPPAAEAILMGPPMTVERVPRRTSTPRAESLIERERRENAARNRRPKIRRQIHVQSDEILPRQYSEPGRAQPRHALLKHLSCPDASKMVLVNSPQQILITGRRARLQEMRSGRVEVTTLSLMKKKAGGNSPTGSPTSSTTAAYNSIITKCYGRAKHTPAIRNGPPLSCNFCWNTVDDTGRILRRKTQYHCPECRTNLCIVPCFQDYHEAAHPEPSNAT